MDIQCEVYNVDESMYMLYSLPELTFIRNFKKKGIYFIVFGLKTLI